MINKRISCMFTLVQPYWPLRIPQICMKGASSACWAQRTTAQSWGDVFRLVIETGCMAFSHLHFLSWSAKACEMWWRSFGVLSIVYHAGWVCIFLRDHIVLCTVSHHARVLISIKAFGIVDIIFKKCICIFPSRPVGSFRFSTYLSIVFGGLSLQIFLRRF